MTRRHQANELPNSRPTSTRSCHTAATTTEAGTTSTMVSRKGVKARETNATGRQGESPTATSYRSVSLTPPSPRGALGHAGRSRTVDLAWCGGPQRVIAPVPPRWRAHPSGTSHRDVHPEFSRAPTAFGRRPREPARRTTRRHPWHCSHRPPWSRGRPGGRMRTRSCFRCIALVDCRCTDVTRSRCPPGPEVHQETVAPLQTPLCRGRAVLATARRREAVAGRSAQGTRRAEAASLLGPSSIRSGAISPLIFCRHSTPGPASARYSTPASCSWPNEGRVGTRWRWPAARRAPTRRYDSGWFLLGALGVGPGQQHLALTTIDSIDALSPPGDHHPLG